MDNVKKLLKATEFIWTEGYYSVKKCPHCDVVFEIPDNHHNKDSLHVVCREDSNYLTIVGAVHKPTCLWAKAFQELQQVGAHDQHES